MTKPAPPSQETESRIKEAARAVFLREGYSGARIRDIAKEAGINLALVNYYFRSKEQLFLAIYQETFMAFINQLSIVLNADVPLEVKIWNLAERYTDFILAHPDAPLFILFEASSGGKALVENFGMKERILKSGFVRQLEEESAAGRIRAVHPLHIMVTLLGSIMFPLIGKPILTNVGGFDEAGFVAFMQDRKRIVPELIINYLKT